MANRTLTQYPAGSKDYRIAFDYLARPFVVVTLVNTTDKSLNRVLTVGSDYRFISSTLIEVMTSQTGFDIVQIHRYTQVDLVVDFRDGSVLTAKDLTNSELQAIHIAEEGRDQTVDLAKDYTEIAINAGKEAQDTLNQIILLGKNGYTPVGSFEVGGTVKLQNDALQFGTGSSITHWRWEGDYPKTVPSGSSPQTTGGIGRGLWIDVTDATLRGQLSSDIGAKLITMKQPWANTIGRTQFDVNMDAMNVKDWGAKGDGVTDDTVAIDNACAALTGSSLVTNFRRLHFPHGTYKYNGAGIKLPNGSTISGDDMFTIIDASSNTNSGYLVTLTGFGARFDTLRIKGNPANPELKGISSFYNTDNGGVLDAIIEDFHFGLDIDKCWYSVYKNIRFRRSSSSVHLNGAHIRIGFNYPNEEVNNVDFSNVWIGEPQLNGVTVHSRTQVLTWNECSFETIGGPRIKFMTSAITNTFVLNSCYIEGPIGAAGGAYLVEAQNINTNITCNDCMFRLGDMAGSLGKNVTIYMNGGWSNSGNVDITGNNTKVWFTNYRQSAGGFLNGPDYGRSGDYDGGSMHSASMFLDPRPMDIRDWNSVIPKMVNYKTHPTVSPVDVFKVFIPAGGSPRMMQLEVTALTKSIAEAYIVGTEKYLIAITLPEASTAGSGTLVTKIASAASSGAGLLSDPAFKVTSVGYDAATDSNAYTISHSVSSTSRLGNTMFTIEGAFVDGGISVSTKRWKIQRL